MSSKSAIDWQDTVGTTLGDQTVFRGVLRFKSSLKILGRYEGRIESEGTLIVGKGAEVFADVKVGSLYLIGTIRGNVEALIQTEIAGSGVLIGDLRTSQLKIEDGTVFEGKVEMIKSPDGVDIFIATPTQLKQSLETL